MRYLILMPGTEPFLTKWFEPENNFHPDMTVYDLAKQVYTSDGENWKEIETDHL